LFASSFAGCVMTKSMSSEDGGSDAYGHAKRGHPILDVWQAFRDTGLDENTDPKIAIARADINVAYYSIGT
jgi:hypothetical protein